MGHLCKYCKKELRKGDPFVLIGNYPSRWDRAAARMWYTFADDLGDYGAVYHQDCFYNNLDNNRHRR